MLSALLRCRRGELIVSVVQVSPEPSSALPSRITVTCTICPTLLAAQRVGEIVQIVNRLIAKLHEYVAGLESCLRRGRIRLHVAETHAVLDRRKIGNRAEIRPVTASAAVRRVTPVCGLFSGATATNCGAPRRASSSSATLAIDVQQSAASGALILSHVSEGL